QSLQRSGHGRGRVRGGDVRRQRAHRDPRGQWEDLVCGLLAQRRPPLGLGLVRKYSAKVWFRRGLPPGAPVGLCGSLCRTLTPFTGSERTPGTSPGGEGQLMKRVSWLPAVVRTGLGCLALVLAAGCGGGKLNVIKGT